MSKGEMQVEVAYRLEEPQVNRYKSTEGLPRRQQVAVSIRDELKPHCDECDQEVTVEHLIWQCASYNSKRRRNSRTEDSIGDNKEETGRLIKYLKETRLLYSI
jgi:ribosomal protein L37AE/L43A